MLPFGSVARYQLLYIIIISNLAKQSTWKSTVKRDITEDKKLLNTRSNVFIFLNQKEVLSFIFDLTLINSIVCLYLCVGEGGGEGEGGGGVVHLLLSSVSYFKNDNSNVLETLTFG